jgi:hypothetical protein
LIPGHEVVGTVKSVGSDVQVCLFTAPKGSLYVQLSRHAMSSAPQWLFVAMFFVGLMRGERMIVNRVKIISV